MKLMIRYGCLYRYERPVSFSPHTVRVFPRGDLALLCQSFEFSTNAGADIQFRRDFYDNEFALCFYPLMEQTLLHFEATFLLEVKSKNPFHFLLAPHALNIPFQYSESERSILAPMMELHPGEEVVELPFWTAPTAAAPAPTIETLSSLNTAVFTNIAYERRDHGAARTPRETIALRTGACRDTARLMAAVLRQMGLAARLVSGYLWEPPGEGEAHAHRAEGAFHAWVETFLPGAGWLGMDGTNGVFCDHTFIAAAAGLTFDDITPISGSYYGNETIASEMSTTLHIEPM